MIQSLISQSMQDISEEIIVKQRGDDFKIELDTATQDNYMIRNNRNILMKERYYKYNKWDIILERKKRNKMNK